jgi:DNA adenine methylase
MLPFLKWAGGKRWLTYSTDDLLPERNTFDRYFEPFLGGGAVFFFLHPERGILSDINPDLINTYQMIRDDWKELNKILKRYQRLHSDDFYYKMRSLSVEDPILKAARFIYLNRTCWNGLYRVNLKGEFNVPIGTKDKVVLETDNFEELSERLSGFKLKVSDFEVVIDKAEEGDFLFVDPPYTVKHNLNGFIKYNENLFSWADQVRLRDAVVRAVRRGVTVLVLNADHASIRTLYKGVGQMRSLSRASIIAGDPAARGNYTELAIKCYTDL